MTAVYQRGIALWMAGAVVAAGSAFAQESTGTIAPPPPLMERIVPEQGQDDGMLSTRPVAKKEAPAPLPWQQEKTAPAPAPIAAPTPPKPNNYMPFGRASAPIGEEIPAGPHTAAAAPVSDIDAVEASEPAPPEPPEEGADPVTEDASAPTELTAPIFGGVEDAGAPRKMLIRVLNKVTAQSTLFRAKPGDTIIFGKLKVNTLMCRVSSPESQADSAALLDIREAVQGKDKVKQLFRGWMYESSPSLTALEHPIYDVTMVGCEIAALAPKTEEKQEKSDTKKPGAKKKD